MDSKSQNPFKEVIVGPYKLKNDALGGIFSRQYVIRKVSEYLYILFPMRPYSVSN